MMNVPHLIIMTGERGIGRILRAYATSEGAGVRLHRAFGTYESPQFDPFLLLDDFRARRPEDYLAGFPDHPHRGIETITYMLEGALEHGDSQGNGGNIGAGDVQWLTTGSGVIHHEMPAPVKGCMGGFQLWVNLPRAHKMMPPRYQEIRSSRIPTFSPQAGISVKVICGSADGMTGPAEETLSEIQFLDVSMDPGTAFTLPTRQGHTAVAYVIGGEGTFDNNDGYPVRSRDAILFAGSPYLGVRSSAKGMRFLFFSGRPINEPVAWRGAVVMNTREELRRAFREYEDGTFVRTGL